MNIFKRLFYMYQQAMFYVAQTGAELSKPLRFYNETLLLLTFLAVNVDLKPAWYQILIAYICVLGIALIVGMILDKIGIVHFNTQLANDRNNDLKEILKTVKEIKNR